MVAKPRAMGLETWGRFRKLVSRQNQQAMVMAKMRRGVNLEWLPSF